MHDESFCCAMTLPSMHNFFEALRNFRVISQKIPLWQITILKVYMFIKGIDHKVQKCMIDVCSFMTANTKIYYLIGSSFILKDLLIFQTLFILCTLLLFSIQWVYIWIRFIHIYIQFESSQLDQKKFILHYLYLLTFQNRKKLLQQLDFSDRVDDKKRFLQKLCNECTGLEIDLEKYASTYGKIILQEKRKEEEVELDHLL